MLKLLPEREVDDPDLEEKYESLLRSEPMISAKFSLLKRNLKVGKLATIIASPDSRTVQYRRIETSTLHH